MALRGGEERSDDRGRYRVMTHTHTTSIWLVVVAVVGECSSRQSLSAVDDDEGGDETVPEMTVIVVFLR